MCKYEFSYYEFTSPLCSWWETAVCFTLMTPSLFPLPHSTTLPPGPSPSPRQGRGPYTVTLPPDANPGDSGLLLAYLNLTEKIQPLSRSHHLLHCLLPGPAHNSGCQNLLPTSLLQWFAECFDTFASENGKTGVNFCLLPCWGLML